MQGRLETLTLHASLLPPALAPTPAVALADLAVRSTVLLPRTCQYLGGATFVAQGRARHETVTQLHCRHPSALPRRATKVPHPRVYW